MAQEFNLAQFANNCDSNGQVPITGATTGTLPTTRGGTGNTSAGTAGQVLVSNGTNFVPSDFTSVAGISGGTAGQVPYQSAPSTTSFAGPGTAGQVLTSNGTAAPTYSAVNLATSASVTGILSTGNGGTGVNTIPLGSVVVGGGLSNPVTTVAPGLAGNVLVSTGTGWTSAAGPTTAYTRTDYIATANQTTFNVAYTVGLLAVYVNGALLTGSEYTATNGTTMVLTSPAISGDVIELIAYASTAIGFANAIAFGGANQLLYQTGPSMTGFIGTGTTGQVLTSGGSGAAPSFQTLQTLPTQTGQAGKYLTTNGTTPSWVTIVVPTQAFVAFSSTGGI